MTEDRIRTWFKFFYSENKKDIELAWISIDYNTEIGLLICERRWSTLKNMKVGIYTHLCLLMKDHSESYHMYCNMDPESSDLETERIETTYKNYLT